MIAAWMLYACAVTGLAGLGALALEGVLRRSRQPTRWAWVAALLLALGLAAGAMSGDAPRAGAAAGAEPPTLVPALPVPALVVEPGSPLRRLDRPLLALWAALSGGLLLAAACYRVALGRARRRWPTVRVAGLSVLRSRRTGPGVVGFLRAAVVLPSWLDELSPEARELVLVHEGEHVAAGDARLLGAGFATLVLMPWNPALWWVVGRLRLAVEVDCDARVLRARPGRAHAYAQLLLEVAGHMPRGVPAALTLTKPPSFLERRIALMTNRSRNTLATAAGLTAAGLTALAVACLVPDPRSGGPDPLAPEVAEDAAAGELGSGREGIREGPVFTPYSVAPDITNRSEVARALEENYPPLLRDAGIGGTARIWLFVDETGEVQDVRINETSGHGPLDQAALRVARILRFTPALNRDEPVSVWVSLPVTFRPRTSLEGSG